MTTTERALLDRFVDASILEPEVARSVGDPLAGQVTAVVPVRDRPDELRRCVDALSRSGVARVIVVDDASTVPIDAAVLGEGPARTVIRLDRSAGPAAARNRGLADVDTELVAFVDSDVEVPPGWLAGLMGHLDDDRVVMVAPRIRSGTPLGAPLDRYEWSASPLDLGSRPGWVSPDAPITYVPAAALLARTDAVRAQNGFAEAMRVGEDVDLVWRLVAAGGRIRYEAGTTVYHDARPSWRATVAQRFAYGTSAAALDRHHPGAVAPARLSRWSLAVWGLGAAGHPWFALALGAWTARALDGKLGPLGVPPIRSARLVAVGHLGAGRQLARAAIRPWAPIAAAAAMLPGRSGRRARRVLGVAIAGSVIRERRARRPTLGLVRWSPRWLVDELAYTAGVWAGVIRHRRVGPLVPRLTDWPDRP